MAGWSSGSVCPVSGIDVGCVLFQCERSGHKMHRCCNVSVTYAYAVLTVMCIAENLCGN